MHWWFHRVWRIVLLPVSLVIFASRTEANELSGKRPNIIFILTDDLGYGDAGCTGNPIIKTPNIDRLYNEGVRFSDFHVSPTCSPSRCAIMTGRHEFHSGVTHTIDERERMSLKATTIAQVLKSAGYTTGIFGKWHLGDEDAYQPGVRGFDEVFIHGGGGIGQTYAGTCGDAPGNTYFDPVIRHNGAFEKTHGFCTDVFFDQAIQWAGQVKGKQPFFLYLATNAPHAPLSCPPEYEKPYIGRVHPLVSKFFGMIANIDENVGRLLGKLDEWGIADDTLVIFMNDNGGFDLSCKIYNAGMKGSKNTPHNGGTRAISLWRWPGTLKPATCDKLTAQIDLFPTFAELAGPKSRRRLSRSWRDSASSRSWPIRTPPGMTTACSSRTSAAGRWARHPPSTAGVASAGGITWPSTSPEGGRFTTFNPTPARRSTWPGAAQT